MNTLHTITNGLRITLQRLHRFGPHSAAVCARTLTHNLGVKLRNRFARNKTISCPICGWRGVAFRALDIGHTMHPNVECPSCHTHDRHRLLHLAYAAVAGPPPHRVLHCAPEPAIRSLLDHHGARHILSTDLSIHPLRLAPKPAVAADATRLPFPDDTIDLLISLHVLEHIPYDRQAIAEYYRVLRPGGRALIMAPMLSWLPKTDDWGHPDPQMFDHYRTYATADATDRFAPFQVTLHSPTTTLTPAQRQQHPLRDEEHLLLAQKPHHP